MKSNDFKLEYQSFPDPLAHDKESREYGLKWGKAIQYEWFRKEDGGQSRFHEKKENYHTLRSYARGEQDTQLYKDLLAPDDSTYTNYDWRPIQVIPKFVKLIVNQMTERLFEINANATDSYSTNLRGEFRKRLESMMVAKDMLKKAEQLQGVKILPDNPDDVPDSQEEIDLRMQLAFKPNAEIAAETAIKFTLGLNDYDEIQSQVIEDIAVLGIGGTKNWTDPHKGVMVDRVDPADMVYSFPDSRDFKNCYYFGEVERMTIGELKRISGKEFTEEELKDLGGSAKSWNSFHGESSTRGNRDGDIDGIMVDVLNFTFKAQDTRTFKKKYNKNGGFKMIKKDSTFEKKDQKYNGYDAVKKPAESWYEGRMVLGTDIIFEYGRATNMIKEKGSFNRVQPKYSMYAPDIYQNRTKSLVGRIIQYVDQMQQIHIKFQQMVAKARPAGVFIDVDGLSEIALGDGKFLSPLEVIKIYDDTGNVLGSSQTAEGGYNYGKEPIRELKNGVVDGLDRLIGAYNFYLNQLRDAIGIPAGMDASNPHPDTLVGVQQQVALNSNTATRHILDSILHITKRTSIGVSLRLKDIFKYSDLKEAYINAIGKINVDILESLKNYHLHDFSILIELRPDSEQRQNLERSIQIALEREMITLDDAIDIREVNIIKLANQLLKIRRQKREKDKKQHEKDLIKTNAEENAKAAERSAQAKQQELQAEFQTKSQLEMLKGENVLKKIQAEEEAKSRLMEKEFYYNMTLRGAEAEFENMKKGAEEEEKVKRQDRNNSQASKLIEQRQNNAPAVNFESSEDNISGSIELGELGPS